MTFPLSLKDRMSKSTFSAGKVFGITLTVFTIFSMFASSKHRKKVEEKLDEIHKDLKSYVPVSE